jgi:hypothetical protein
MNFTHSCSGFGTVRDVGVEEKHRAAEDRAETTSITSASASASRPRHRKARRKYPELTSATCGITGASRQRYGEYMGDSRASRAGHNRHASVI